MLKRQLDAIAGLKLPNDIKLEVVVIENGPNPSSSELVADFQKNLSIGYHTEPRIGLVFARNQAVEQALKTGAEWIGFFDDDEVVDANWVVAMIDATEKFPEARAFAGPVDRINPGTATKWYPAHKKPVGKTGMPVWRVATGNILFHRDIYTEDGLNMRFDERFNLTGGEDMHLFLRMRQRGAKNSLGAGRHLHRIRPARARHPARTRRSRDQIRALLWCCEPVAARRYYRSRYEPDP